MKYIEYPLFAEGFINRFLTTGIYTQPQHFEKAVLSGKVNEWLKYGFSIHENPCRKEFLDQRRKQIPQFIDLSQITSGEKIEVFGQSRSLNPYFPFGNVGVEESGFYYVPTYLRSYSYCIVVSEKSETLAFELTTCGGLTLWVNGQLITDFAPFTRNMVKHTIVEIPLQAGENTFVVCLDDLAERDTDYYFRIRRIGDSSLMIRLPAGEHADPEEIKQLETLLEQMYFDKEVFIGEPVILQFDNHGVKDLKPDVAIIPGEFIEKMEHQEELVVNRTYLIKKNQKSLALIHSDEIRPGYYYFSVALKSGGILLKRKIGTQLVRKDFLEMRSDSLIERKQQALNVVIQYGVDNVYKAAAYFKLGQHLDLAEAIIHSELPGVRARKDCSDFHFVIILYIYKTFAGQMSEQLKKEIEETMLGYRYWIDEPGDDVMWFFSENHALLFHICQYLAGQYLPDEIFVNSGLSGSELHDKAVTLLDVWFDSFFAEFITEWNSSAYIPVDVLGLGTLYNLTEPGSAMHEKAKKALDMVFYCLCINEHKGAVMTSFGRTYEKEMKGNYNTGTTSMLYVAYRAGSINRAALGYISLVLGDYEAPEEYRELLELSGDQVLIHQNTQGFEQHVNLYLYKDAEVLLSTAVGFKPYQNGYQEHIVQATIDKSAQVFINHPGESQPYGSGRPNFWAGNGILPMAMQHRNLSIVHYHIPDEHRIDYTHAYIPLSEFDRYMGESHTIVMEKDGGYIGVRAYRHLDIQQEGPCRYREIISRGRQNLWIIKAARERDYDSLEAFFDEMKAITMEMTPENEVAVRAGNTVYRIDRNHQCFVNDEPAYQYPLSVAGVIKKEWV